MPASVKMFLTVLGASTAFFLVLAFGQAALAAGPCGCAPPPCCAPPTPPTPPTPTCCQPPSHTVTIPGVDVFVGATLIVNANVQAQAGAQASGAASGQTAILVGGGGGGGGGNFSPGNGGLIQNLAVVGGNQMNRESYEASRTVTKKVVIQAVCIDDKDVPHPASQVTPDRDIEDAYDNELYRCIAGTHMQYTLAVYNGQVDFSHGQTVSCAKNEALYHAPGGHVECRAQKPARDCNERSLLRRFGAGVKILTMITTEKYSSFREQTTETSNVISGGSISLDGGVGGVTY